MNIAHLIYCLQEVQKLHPNAEVVVNVQDDYYVNGIDFIAAIRHVVVFDKDDLDERRLGKEPLIVIKIKDLD